MHSLRQKSEPFSVFYQSKKSPIKNLNSSISMNGFRKLLKTNKHRRLASVSRNIWVFMKSGWISSDFIVIWTTPEDLNRTYWGLLKGFHRVAEKI